MIDLSCVSGFLQHLIFIKDQACWLTHGAIFPFVIFFYWPLTGSSRMNEGLSVPASAIQARGVLPYTSHIGMSTPKGRVFAPLWSENGYRLSSIWSGIKNRVWFSRELRECTKVFIVSIPNEQQRKRNMPIRNGF